MLALGRRPLRQERARPDRQQQETDRTVKAWVDALGERQEGQAALVLIETLRAMALDTVAKLRARDEPRRRRSSPASPSPSSASKAPTSSARPERAAEKEKAEKEKAEKEKAEQPKRRGGLSPEAVAIIRAEVEGGPPPPTRPHRKVTTAPVDPWDPESFPAIRDNPGESTQSRIIPTNPT